LAKNNNFLNMSLLRQKSLIKKIWYALIFLNVPAYFLDLSNRCLSQFMFISFPLNVSDVDLLHLAARCVLGSHF
jgi:hypothetical protein